MVSSCAGTAANAVQKAAGKGELTVTGGKPPADRRLEAIIWG